MEGKVDKTIVKSILVAWWLNFAILLSIGLIAFGIIMNIVSEKNTKSNEKNSERAICINNGGCWVNNRCQNPCVGRW